MNYRGSYKKLLGNSKAAMMAAIEIYNKPMFEYRDDCTVILLLNAWELMLKALLSKNKKSVFYPKQKDQPYRTLSWKDALPKAQPHFPASIPCRSVQNNLELLGKYRDNAIHFYTATDFSVVLYALAQASIKNYRDLLKGAFNIDFEDEINWYLLPLGINPPVDLMSYLAAPSKSTKSGEVHQFLSELKTAMGNLTDAGEDTGRLMTVFKVKLESVKKIEEADATVGVNKPEKSAGALAVIRHYDPNMSHPLRQREILEKIPELHGKRFTSYTFQAIVWKYRIKDKSQYCWVASEGVLTRYSNDTVAFVRSIRSADIEALLIEYGEFRRTQPKRKA